MTTKQLLSSNSYIQFPKFLGAHIGANEALILSAFCEIDSWCELNILNYDGWFYALQSDIHWETGLSEKQQRLAIQHLIDIDLLKSDRRGLPAKNYYFIDSNELENRLDIAYTEYKLHKSQMLPNVTSRSDEMEYQDVTKSEFLLLNKKEINNKNIKKPVPPALSKKHPRNFDKKTLTDDLASGKDIDEQTKEKKKTSEYDKCLDVLQKRNYSPDLFAVTKEHLYWSFNSKDPKRIKSAKMYSKRLDELDKLNGDKLKIVIQSLEKEWHCFYEVNNTSTNRKLETKQDTIKIRDLDEAKKAMQDKIARGVEVF